MVKETKTKQSKAKPFYMKPWFWALAVIAIIGLWFVGTYNNLVALNRVLTTNGRKSRRNTREE